MDYPRKVTITEVGPRDGLQNENTFVPSALKKQLIVDLSNTGLENIEVTSFVSEKVIPQLADHEAIYRSLDHSNKVTYSVLVPNERGMQNAIAAGVKKIALFTAASESFNQRNINCSISESIKRFIPVVKLALQEKIEIRAYISCVLGCPYEGSIAPKSVTVVAQQLLDLGIKELSLGDTIGVGTPLQTNHLLDEISKIMPNEHLVMHFHDTYGQAIANIYASLLHGVSHFDSAIAGLGGCPYALGASGNVATEDILYLMHGLGIETGIDIFKIIEIGKRFCTSIGRQNQSKVANAMLAPH